MARRRRADAKGVERFADDRVDTWLTDADRAAVAAACLEELPALIGGLRSELRMRTIPKSKWHDWTLACLASGHRCRAIAAWAQANNIDPGRALDYFLDEIEVRKPEEVSR